MPDRIFFAVVGLWVTSLVALLTVAPLASDAVVFVLFGVTMSSAALVVASCYGLVGLLRLLALALVGGVGIAVVAYVLLGDAGLKLSRALVPLAIGLLGAVVERRRRLSQP